MDWQQVIQELRESGLTQAGIAELSGLSDSQVSELGSGKTKDILWRKGDPLFRLYKKRCGSAKKRAA